MNIINHLVRNFDGEHILLSDMQDSFQVADIIERCQQFSEQMDALGGRRLALCADNGVDWLVADFACQFTDRCLLPLPVFFSVEQMRFAIEVCAADFLLTDNPALGKLNCIDDSVDPQPVAGTRLQLYRLKTANDLPSLPAATGKITFTSGSTGTPKGVCLSHTQQLQQAHTLRDCVAIDQPRHLCLLPLSTLLENIAGAYAPILAGGQLIVPEQRAMGFAGSGLVDPSQLLACISRAQPNTLILVPELLQVLVSAAARGWTAPDSLQFIAVGGSKVAPELIAQSHNLGLPVYEGYGLSECCSVVSLNTPGAERPGSCGLPLPNLEVEIDAGEVVVRGNTMLGYVNEPDSWYPEEIRTGDLGRFDADGFLIIQGRRKNLLISSFGRNISPEWVESELLAFPAIAEAVVFGDAKPYCVALLSVRDPNLGSEELRKLVATANSHLPDYAQIRQWHLLSTPMASREGLFTDNGRPRRHAIAAFFNDELESLYADSKDAAAQVVNG